MTDHPPAERLADLLLGKLLDDSDVSRHVETCSVCQAKLETLHAADSLTVALGQVKESPQIAITPACDQALQELEQV